MSAGPPDARATTHGIAVFDLDPGRPGGKTSITIRYFHAPGADTTPTPNYVLFESVVLAKDRKHERSDHDGDRDRDEHGRDY
jgi:hypothetical protein